jgi:hypothetical protein
LSEAIVTDPEVLTKAGWAKFVDNHPQGTVFQSPDMYELFRRTARMKPLVIGLLDEQSGELKGILLAVMIRELIGMAGYFSSRAVIYGGPLTDPNAENSSEIIQLLLQRLIRETRMNSVFIQFRNFNSQENNKKKFNRAGFHYRERLNLIVDTRNLETIKRNISASRLRQVKKGLSSGAKVIAPKSLEQVKEFYDILYHLYKYKVKKPLPGWDFFEQFYNLSREERLGIIRLVEYEGKIIGGILSPVTPGKTIYEWYVCGLDHLYKGVYPSVLATWAALEYATENNISQFDFMGVGIPQREYGVRDFKIRFGGEMVNYGRFARVNNRFVYFTAELGYNLLALMKKI